MKDLQKLLESELLTAEVKKNITEALEEAKVAIREELEVSFAKKFVKDKQDMNIKLVSIIDECVTNEIGELREDIVNARTLEVRYAKKLEDFKQEYVQKMNEALNNVVGAHVAREFSELRGDLLEAKKNHVFSKAMELVTEEFRLLGLSETEAELKAKLDEANAELNSTKAELQSATREVKLESLLSNLSGNKREVMRTVLETVSEARLEDRYNASLKAILTEETSPVPAINTSTNDSTKVLTEASNGKGKVVLESAPNAEKEAARRLLRRQAGLEG